MKWVLLAFLCVGCAEPDFAQGKRPGERFRVELYSGGKLVREWVSVGTVGRKGGVYNFKDESTGDIVYVPDGSLVITSIEE